jgi:O-methyltransferase
MIKSDETVRLYLDAMKKLLTASVYEESSWNILEESASGNPRTKFRSLVIRFLRKKKLLLVYTSQFDPSKRLHGEDWPIIGFTMIGTKRLDNLQECIERVLKNNVIGDFVECGVWRGGASIFARAVFKAFDVSDRTVWLADSFEGMPRITSDKDKLDSDLSENTYLRVSLEKVKQNFELFGLMDSQVKFIKGWFSESLPKTSIDRIAVLRLDGDHYSSTKDCLENLYDKVSVGGCIIIDDYNSWRGCKLAVSEFRVARGIKDSIIPIDRQASYWIRS